jgi:hypothetical protein
LATDEEELHAKQQPSPERHGEEWRRKLDILVIDLHNLALLQCVVSERKAKLN